MGLFALSHTEKKGKVQIILEKATYLAHLIDQYQNQNLIMSKMEASDYNLLASALLQPKEFVYRQAFYKLNTCTVSWQLRVKIKYHYTCMIC